MKKTLRTIGVFALCIIGACIIIFIIGWIVDLGAQQQIKKESEKSLILIKKYMNEPANNAWDYYKHVIEDMKSRKFDFAVTQYIEQEIELSPEVEVALAAYPDVVEFVRQGNMQPNCRIPIDYEEGALAKLPEYIHLSSAAKLISGQALAALEQNALDRALDRHILGLLFAKRILNGSPILINYMVSLVMIGVQLRTLEIALAHDAYETDNLESLEAILALYEKDMPSLLTSLELEQASMTVTVARWPVGNPLFTNIGVLQNNVFENFAERLICWRSVFSPRNSMLKAIRYSNTMFASARQSAAGKQGIDEDLAVLAALEKSDPDDYARKNISFALYMPNFRGMFARKLKQQARIRMVLCAVLLRIHAHRFGNFPEILDAFDPAVTCDPFTNETWEYVIQDRGITLQSPGFDRNYGTDDDLELILHRE
ncbi:hypothetical protein JXB22_10010 [candidate division WOR-3 bacterium]|nr:hypothetical protein [candidate division WOR-3 bacterium]